MPRSFEIAFEQKLDEAGWVRVQDWPVLWKRPDKKGPRFDTANALCELLRGA